jgi:RimJ/RimL family protein N-acetyltransferase
MSLVGRYVALEPLTLDHLSALCEVGLDEDLWRWTTSQVRSADDMRRWVEQALALRDAGSALPFATVERATGRVVGSSRFANMEPAHRRVEIGWTWVARPWQRTPINTEAKLLMLTHAFHALGCVRVELKTDALNARSRAAIARLGAVEEGTLRRHMITESGRVRDTVYFSVLDDEWPAVRAGLARRLDGA